MATFAAIETDPKQALPRRDLPPVPDERGGAVVRFLTAFGRALQKRRVYPAGHPMRLAAQQAALEALRPVWQGRRALQVGVTRTQLLFDDIATDPAHFALRDLSTRLHRRRVGNLVLRAGVTAGELGTVLERIDSDDAEPIAAWCSDHAELAPLAFDALVLDEQGGGDREIDALWRELVTVVSGTDATHSLGAVLARRLGVPEVSAAVRQTMERLGRVAADPSAAGRGAAERQLQELLGAVPSEDLTRVLGIAPGSPDAGDAIAQVTEWLPALALVELIEQAAAARGQPISSLLLRMLRKMARHPSAGPTSRTRGEQDVREIVRGLLDGWTLADPSSASHSHVLESLSRYDLAGADDDMPSDDALRIVQMAVETNTFGDPVAEAVVRAATTGSLDAVVGLADTASDLMAAQLWGLLTTSETLPRILILSDDESESICQVLSHTAAGVLADVMDRTATFSPAVRQLIGDRMLAIGDDVGREINHRLASAGEAERRELLAALLDLNELPVGLSVRSYAEAEDPLLRLDAYRLIFRLPSERDEGIHAALADPDERVVAAALSAGQDHFPRASLTRLFVLVNGTARSEELRAAAVAILAQFDVAPVREWLLSNVAFRRGWFRLLRLAPKSPVVVAQVRVLAQLGGADPDPAVLRVLRLARRSGDPDLVAAAEGGATP